MKIFKIKSYPIRTLLILILGNFQYLEAAETNRILEIHVNSTKSDASSTAQIIWVDAEGRNSVVKMDRPFDLEWIPVPIDAVAFQVLPLNASVSSESEMELIFLDELETPSEYLNYNMVIKIPDSEEYNSNDQRENIFLHPQSPQKPNTSLISGWVYLGDWSTELAKWGKTPWLKNSPSSSTRQKTFIDVHPKSLVNKNIIANFPINIRESPKLNSKVLDQGVFVRPGSKVKINDLHYDIVGSDYGVWAFVELLK